MTTSNFIFKISSGSFRVDELIGMGFQLGAAGVILLVGPAVDATPVLPGVIDASKKNVSRCVVE